jgi:hypothetical protein
MFPGSKPSLHRDRGDVLSGALTRRRLQWRRPTALSSQVVWVPLDLALKINGGFLGFEQLVGIVEVSAPRLRSCGQR